MRQARTSVVAADGEAGRRLLELLLDLLCQLAGGRQNDAAGGPAPLRGTSCILLQSPTMLSATLFSFLMPTSIFNTLCLALVPLPHTESRTATIRNTVHSIGFVHQL